MLNHNLTNGAIFDIVGTSLPGSSATAHSNGEYLDVELMVPYGTITRLAQDDWNQLQVRLRKFGGNLVQRDGVSYQARLPHVPIQILFEKKDRDQFNMLTAELDSKLSSGTEIHEEKPLRCLLAPGTVIQEYVWAALEARYESRGFTLTNVVSPPDEEHADAQLVLVLARSSPEV